MPASILILEDDEGFRRNLAFILKRAGFLVTAVDYPRAALDALAQGAYDLLILDLKLPEIDGLMLLTEIRKTHPRLPMMVLTGYGDLNTAIESLRMNVRDYLVKPIEPDLLVERIKKLIAEEEINARRLAIVSQMRGLLSELEQLERPLSTEGDRVLPAVDAARYLQKGNFLLDMKTQQLEFHGRAIALPPSTFNYLVTLLRHSPHPVSFNTLVMEAQGYAVETQEARSISRWQVFQLRQAIEPDPNHPAYILTVRNTGYRLVASGGKMNPHDLESN